MLINFPKIFFQVNCCYAGAASPWLRGRRGTAAADGVKSSHEPSAVAGDAALLLTGLVSASELLVGHSVVALVIIDAAINERVSNWRCFQEGAT